ncbi:MAG: esterase [Paenibacillaceae bacterium]|jgi:predicted alpha/beta superfamily hydrolase|nr:esterase [Paenibacillaceae bacterium]
MTNEPTGKSLNLPPPETPPVGFALAGTECMEVRSNASGREYRIMLALPQSPPPAAGYPVIYLLDAEMCFGTAVEAVRWQTKPPKGYDPAVVVGIGYPPHLERVQERFFDYTTPADLAKLPDRGSRGPWPPLGGADAFLDFIEQELMPAVEARFPVDRSRLAFMGHSMGGFLVLHALFTRKPVFRTYVAGSPSIWWNGNELLEEEAVFRRKLEEEAGDALAAGYPGRREDQECSQKPERMLLIAAGGHEGGGDSRMLENAMEMGARLSALHSLSLNVVVKEFEGEGHISVVPALLAKGIRLALARNGEERAWNV